MFPFINEQAHKKKKQKYKGLFFGHFLCASSIYFLLQL